MTERREDLSLARHAWTCFEPIHALVYFAPEARETYEAAGLRGGWMGYFASRSAPMGPVTADVVVAVFHNFQPAMVRRAIPDAWRLSSVESVLAARLTVADIALRRVWGDDVDSADVQEAATSALALTERLSAAGHPLYAGHAGLDVPDAPHLALWHACTLLREHRFDTHVAALTVHEIDGLDALILATAAGGFDAAMIPPFRGWTDEEVRDAKERLRGRGLLDANAQLTREGAAVRADVEDQTDLLAAEPWLRMDAAARERLLTLLRELALHAGGDGGIVYPNPIGVPRPQ